jgi:hypothetical protein
MTHLGKILLSSWEGRFICKKKFLNEFGIQSMFAALGIWGANTPFDVAYFSLLLMFSWLLLNSKDLEIGLTKINRETLSHRDLLILEGAYRRYTGLKVGITQFPVFLIGWFMLGAAVIKTFNE